MLLHPNFKINSPALSVKKARLYESKISQKFFNFFMFFSSEYSRAQQGFTNFQELELHIRSSHVLNGLPYGYPLYRKNPLSAELLMSQSKSAILPPRKEKVSFLFKENFKF